MEEKTEMGGKEKKIIIEGFGAERFVASLLALTSFGSYNTGYTAHFTRQNSAFGGTSYSPNTLGEIVGPIYRW
jgi:hypothetical protein